MTTLTKNPFVHAVSATPGTPAMPGFCFDDGSEPVSPGPTPASPGVPAPGTGGSDGNPYVPLPVKLDPTQPVPAVRPPQPGDPVSMYDPAWYNILKAWHALHG